MIEVRGLTKSFGGVVALRGIDLDVAAGQFLTIFGPNGAGKTTFIRILAMLSRATAGYVRIEGLNLTEGAIDIRRRIGLIPHNPLLYGDLTPEENLRFYGKMYDVPDLEERIETVLGQVGLAHRRHDPVRTFSRGMQQRLSIARAILHNPSIMLLDEPYTGLDQHAARVLEEILETVGTGSRTVVMTTHNLERGLAMCDRVAILVDGQILYQADRSDLDVSSLQKIYDQHVSVM
ncbi:MAG: heme ABC exporter ATP-binding protein CcmA [Anaerolineae bacterium]